MFRLSLFFFLLFSSFAVTGSLMPLYLQYRGLHTGQIGFLMAMGSIVAVLGQPFFGYLSDKFQSTKKVLISVMSMTLILSTFFFSATTFYTLLFIFMFQNFFASAQGPLAENITINYCEKNNKNYGAIRMWGDIGSGTSAVVLGFFMGIFGMGRVGLMFQVIVMSGILLAFMLRDDRTVTETTAINFHSLSEILTNKRYIWFLILSILIYTTHRMNDSLLSVYLSTLGATETEVGIAWMIATFATTPFFILISKLLKQYRELTLILIGAIIYVLRWFLYSIVDSIHGIQLLQLMNGITFPLFMVPAMFLATRLVPKRLAATGQTLFIAVIIGLGGLIGSWGGGSFMALFGPQATYRLGSVITLFGAILCGFTLYMTVKKHA